MNRSLTQLLGSGLLALAAFGGGTARASEVPVQLVSPAVAAVSVEWVHARVTDQGIAVAGRLHQGAGRATRAGVLVTVAQGGPGGPVRSVRSSAFANGNGGATFSVLLPRDAVVQGAPLSISLTNGG